MHQLIGFLIALAVGLTGIGGGSFTVPALVLIVGLLPGVAVGTAFVFAGVLRLIAAPFYLAGRHIHWRYMWLLVLGAVPGLLLGTYILQKLSSAAGSPTIIILLGLLLTASSSVTFFRRIQNHGFARKNSGWLPALAFPIGVEAGFSSAGAGALGTVLLLNYSEMTPPEVVGTDILFGLVLAVIGSAFHWTFGSISNTVLVHLLEGGIPGVVLGCLFARRVPARKLKFAIALIAICAGLQMVWTGSRSLMAQHAAKSSSATSRSVVHGAPKLRKVTPVVSRPAAAILLRTAGRRRGPLGQNMNKKISFRHSWLPIFISILCWIPGAHVFAAGEHEGAVETIVLVRHGEKTIEERGQLSCKGLNRALALPDVLIKRYGKPDFIYAPNPSIQMSDGKGALYSYVRPLITIEPTAIRLAMPVDTQIGFNDIEKLQEELTQAKYANSLIFVAWEHRFLYEFARGMLRSHGKDPSVVPAWPGTDYDTIYVFHLARTTGTPEVSFEASKEMLDGSLSDSCPGSH